MALSFEESSLAASISFLGLGKSSRRHECRLFCPGAFYNPSQDKIPTITKRLSSFGLL
jgi:hypothetical protein